MSTNSVNFKIPKHLNAIQPPERRGIRRDHVRMMVLNKETGNSEHSYFYHLDKFLEAGDLLVLNNSRTIPAVVFGKIREERIEVRLARHLEEGKWQVLIVDGELNPGDQLTFSNNLYGEIILNMIDSPFSILNFSKTGSDLWNEIYEIGEPVRYEYIKDPWPLSDYQTVYGSAPGSVEMASAGRAFSWELLHSLKQKGINIAYLQLHTGLSYLLDDKWHLGPEHNIETFNVPKETIEVIYETKVAKKKVIAVGTTVVRTLETIGKSEPLFSGKGDTNLHIDKDFKLKVVDGLITGFHEPDASHLDLLTAFIDEEKLEKAYHLALDEGYLWHEFGDINLIM